MHARTPLTSLWGMLAALIGFVLWTWLTLSTSWLHWLDHWRPVRLAPDGALAEVARAVAVLTWPLVIWGGLIAMAIWAWRRRLRRLAWALLASGGVAWAVSALVKRFVRRPRPESAFGDLFTSSGWAYPSTHMVMITTAALMVAVVASSTRRRRWVQLWRRAGAVAAMAVVFADRWLLGVHWASDLIGGALLGAATTSATLLVCGVRTLPPWDLVLPRTRASSEGRRCAVVFNPTKVLDPVVFERIIADELREHGWQPPIMMPTTPDDPGHEMTQRAVADDVDLVLAAGGDGTVRVVSSELVNTGIPLGLIPAGTANLLARNLGIPHDDEAALDIALGGVATPIDVVRVRVDQAEEPGPREHFAVMGGMGIDAKVMSDTSSQLKKTVKSVAYGVAVAQNLNHQPTPVKVWVDDELVADRPASLILLGNVGEIQAGLQLFPGASATDGSVDVLVTGPRGVAGWVQWGLGIVTRQRWKSVVVSGRRVRIEASEPMPYQLDGDTLGTTTGFEARVIAGGIRLMLPRR